ncbi:MAG TPA: 1-phosphofructokinase family hexose kinase [Candidatus Hydrogenedentes bacterium]|nr:1-phosphofructokinase family hexose kinase [Candidatus Hydrogenedentota bacterium]HOR51713.1 1-phosphofructokinase family hexose kinase [Candidatus Hydrogenedentota bacterium]HPK25692.1 1-phosphofructokinase family hexose kinase [Candidatus Hydrogenedentota bacterium]
MILTVTPNPCIDKTLFIRQLTAGAKIRAPRYSCITGGKGCNVSRAVRAMGGETNALFFAAGHTGKHAVEMLEQDDGVPCLPVWVSGMTRTITTVLEEPLHRQTALFEPGPPVNREEYQAFLQHFREHACRAALVTLNGAASNAGQDTLYFDLIQIAHACDVPVILDAYGAIFAEALKARPYMVKPNLEEMEALTGKRLPTRREQWEAVDFLLAQGITLVVLSLGDQGALVASGDWHCHLLPPAIQEVNPVGSGDALVAGFALGLTQGRSLEDTARLGIAMGTANAMTWDIGVFHPEEVAALQSRITITPRQP